ncbi:amidohydrolase family protein [Amycolatopsis sp. 195334CR]|uniref:amidohydrolase family protein n=1 Tax=Amycolatopsis sp. 195334CR TaxID=2814588 RepID=UPI001A8ED1A3|nr:amidohydrolase family protein [Amycolatopsis sp. 195334CR]MBN6034089.1 amidohydrolase family protein [Amycolatopsis sp. 195334CR]
MYSDDLLQPWLDVLLWEFSGLELFDIHTHLGLHDPSGFHADVTDLQESLARVRGRAAVFSLAEPRGYRAANDSVIEAAQRHTNLAPFCRVFPHDDPLREVERCVDRGAAGIKLHPASDEFSIDDERLNAVFELAEEQRLPVLLHAGPEITPLGDSVTGLFERRPDLRLILAHAGLSDLSWLSERATDLPNLFFDTSWWSTTDLLLLIAGVPPGNVLFASDLPYATPVWAARCAVIRGLELRADHVRYGRGFDRQLN